MPAVAILTNVMPITLGKLPLTTGSGALATMF
jgi:hypothetical protein